MSYTELIIFKKDKELLDKQERYLFSNPWKGAYCIWNFLYKKYVFNKLDDSRNLFESFEKTEKFPEKNPLWSLYLREDIPTYMRVCLLFTCDFAYIKKENIDRFIIDLSLLITDSEFSLFIKSNYSNNIHLPEWLKILKKIQQEELNKEELNKEELNKEELNKEELVGVGLYVTSVIRDMWLEKELEVNYNFEKNKDKFDVYDFLDKNR